MGFRASMLAIAAWRLFLLYPAVLSQNISAPNPLIPQGFSSNVGIELTFRSAAEVVGPFCGKTFPVEAANEVIDFSRPDLEVNAALVRSSPQVELSGIDPGAYYTWMIVNQKESMDIYGTEEKPLIQEMRVNIQRGDINTGVVVTPYAPVIPDVKGNGAATILLYKQKSIITDPSVVEFVRPECLLGLRCVFNVNKYSDDNNLTLAFAGSFGVTEDEFSLHTLFMFNEKIACHRLWRLKVAENPLIGVAELKVGIKARFETKEIVTEPLCARVFHYMDDDVYVSWNATKALKARKIRSLPQVHLRHMMEKHDKKGPGSVSGNQGNGTSGGAGNKTSGNQENQDMWFTLLLVDQSVIKNNTAEMPFVNWVVSNIKNLQVNTGDCSVPYFPILVPRGMGAGSFLLYKQSERVEIDPSEYSTAEECMFQYRCNWDISKLVDDKNLELVGALPFHVEADPFSVTHWVEKDAMTKMDGCKELKKFKDEGRMLGECLPKYDAWKALKKELDECVVEFKKKMIMERMANMCPELGSHFSAEMKKWAEESMEDANKGAVGEYMKEKDDKKDGDMMDMKKDEMEMFIKKFLMTSMEKIDSMKEGKEGNSSLAKDGNKMIGPHCIQVVMKYMAHMKQKMMNGDDKMDDDNGPDMKEGGKCLEAAKTFMKEMWAKYQMKKAEEKKKEGAKKEWESWRNWGKHDEEKKDDKEKKGWEKMMKEMWEKEEKQKQDDGMEKKKEMMEYFKMKMMKEFAEKMKEGEKKEESKEHEDKEAEKKDKWEDKWESWKNWGKEGESKEHEDKEAEKKDKWEDKWESWKNWGKEGENKEHEGKEAEKKDKWEDKWESWKNWGKEEGDKKEEKRDADMKQKFMEHMKEKMAAEMKQKFMEHMKEKMAEEMKHKFMEHMKEKMAEEMKHKFMEHMKEKMAEEMKHKLMEKMKEKMAEEFKEKCKEHMKEKMAEEMKHKFMEHMKEKMSEEMKHKFMEHMKEKMAEEMKHKFMEHMKEKMSEEMKHKFMEHMKEKMAEEMKHKFMEHMKEKMSEEMKHKFMEHMKEKMSEEMKQKFMEHMKEKMAEEMKHKFMEHMKEKMAEEMKHKFMEHMKEKMSEEMKHKFMEHMKEKMSEEMKHKFMEHMKEKMAEEMKEKFMEEKKEKFMEEMKEKFMEEKKEKFMEEMKEKFMEGMKEKMAKEMKEKMADELKKKMMMSMYEKMKKEGEKKDEEKQKWDKMTKEMWGKAKEGGQKEEDKWGKMMEEMGKKWEEQSGKQTSEQEQKEKKMAFLLHAFKAFLVKHMEMKEKLDMVQEYFKHKMAMEKRCPLSDESSDEKDSQSKCMGMFKEMMMKKKFMEMLKEEADDMKEKKDKPDMSEEKEAFFKKMVAGMMGGMGDKYEGKKDEM